MSAEVPRPTFAKDAKVGHPSIRMGELGAMIESLPPPHPEPLKDWFPTAVYGSWCVIGASGALISFWKQGTTGHLGLVCYTAVLVLALHFLVASRTRRPTRRDVSSRCSVLLSLSVLPWIVHLLLMK